MKEGFLIIWSSFLWKSGTNMTYFSALLSYIANQHSFGLQNDCTGYLGYSNSPFLSIKIRLNIRNFLFKSNWNWYDTVISSFMLIKRQANGWEEYSLHFLENIAYYPFPEKNPEWFVKGSRMTSFKFHIPTNTYQRDLIDTYFKSKLSKVISHWLV